MAHTPARILIAILSAFPCIAETWYVNAANQLGVQDGKSWASPFVTIQPAIDAAHKAGGGEVWVAAGLYGEPRSYREDGIETGALVVRDGISLYGGFAGHEERRAIRDFERAATVISGRATRGGSKAYHTVVMLGTSRLDGFIVRDGLANGDARRQRLGGGVYCVDGKPTIENCVIAENIAWDHGAGAYFENAEPQIARCTFRRDEVLTPRGKSGGGRNGGGIAFVQCKNAIVRSTLIENCVASDQGGGIQSNKSTVVVIDTSFVRNRAINLAGGAQFYAAAASLTDCTFVENTSGHWVGGLRFAAGAVGTVENCRFEKNIAALKCGALNCWRAGETSVTKSVFLGNRADSNDAGALLIEESTLTVRESTFKENSAPAGSAITVAGASVTLDKCSIEQNANSAFAIHAEKDVLTLTNSRVNSARTNLLWLFWSSQPVATLAQAHRHFPHWKNNIDLASPSPTGVMP